MILSRSYDLRAIYPDEIDEDFFFRFGYAFAKYTGHTRIAVWYDARLSGLSLAESYMNGIDAAGGTPINLWLVSTDMLGFATCHYDDIESWVMITASHNPKEYNGVKCLDHNGNPYNLKKYGEQIGKIMEGIPQDVYGFHKKMWEFRDVRWDFANHVTSFLREKDYSWLQIVVDAWNGAAGAFIEALEKKTLFECIPLFLEPDGNFPNHHPNPIIGKNREDARKKVIETHADGAFIFDWDADRIMILDEHGTLIPSWVIASIIASKLLTGEPWATFIGNAVTSHIYSDTVQILGGVYEREKVGHIYIREHMKKNPNIVFAAEHSAHYFFRDNFCIDSGILVGMMILDMMKSEGKKLSEIGRKYMTYITLEETNYTVKDPQSVITALKKEFYQEHQDTLDWFTVSYADTSWWNVRPSSNEPLLRLNIEAKTQDRFDELYRILMEALKRYTLW